MIAKGSCRLMHGLLAGASLVLPALAHAQTAPTTSPDRVTQLSFSFDARYDTNIARANAAQAASRGLALADQRFTPSAQLTITRSPGPTHLTVTADVGYAFHRNNTLLNRERLAFGGDLGIDVGPCTFSVLPRYQRRQSDLAEIQPTDTPGANSVRNTEATQDYEGRVACGSKIGIRPYGNIERVIGDNANIRRQVSNYRTTRYGGGISYSNPNLGDFSLGYVRDQTRYPLRPSVFGRGFESETYLFNASRQIGANLTASGNVGYVRLAPSGLNVQGFNGFSWKADIVLTPTPDLQLSASIERNVQPSLNVDALYVVGRNYEGAASYAINDRMTLKLSGLVQPRNYRGSGTSLGQLLVNDVRQSIGGELTFRTSSRLSFALNTGYQRRNADGTFFDYSAVFGGLTAHLTL